ncbi:hypothetical protein ACTMU2_37050 [Cupriavidus basilensis]
MGPYWMGVNRDSLFFTVMPKHGASDSEEHHARDNRFISWPGRQPMRHGGAGNVMLLLGAGMAYAGTVPRSGTIPAGSARCGRGPGARQRSHAATTRSRTALLQPHAAT